MSAHSSGTHKRVSCQITLIPLGFESVSCQTAHQAMRQSARVAGDLKQPEGPPEPDRRRTRGQTTPVKERGRKQRPEALNSAQYSADLSARKREAAARSRERAKEQKVSSAPCMPCTALRLLYIGPPGYGCCWFGLATADDELMSPSKARDTPLTAASVR